MTNHLDSKAVPDVAATPAQKPKPKNESPAGKLSAEAKPAGRLPPPDSAVDDFDEAAYLRGRFVLFNALPSSVVSGVIHFIAFLILALTSMNPPPQGEVLSLSAGTGQQAQQVEQLEEQIFAPSEDNKADLAEIASHALQGVSPSPDAPLAAVDVGAASQPMQLTDFGERMAPKSDLLSSVGNLAGSGLDSRGASERGQMLQSLGGTPQSEAAVEMALKWFVEHQNKDGSWNFDHRVRACRGQCSDPGSLDECRTGATAMALLPFLGAGQTHQQGQYKEVVDRGLYYLTNHMRVRNQGDIETGDLSQAGGTMYAHGLAAITLCEAYAMTHDRKLMLPAQLSLNHIMVTQDPVGGGWRYFPRQPGDTSVVGWQIMALKSGHMAYLVVDPRTIQGATRFLDSVQYDGGTMYGYTSPERSVGGSAWATSAAGLLCRMYVGWKQDNPTLKQGVALLSETGPMTVPLANMYYNYYATQVLRQYCGDPGSEGHEMWEKWNTKMRDWLIATQDKSGHARGSWFLRGDHGGERGGRLYYTSLAAMTLEIYYRHMPIYGKRAATEDFPL
jgi:hypothetical protein